MTDDISRVVHVEHLALDARSTTRALALLDRKERRKAKEFRHETARDQYILGRSALKVVLGEYLGLAAAQIEIETGPCGKPRLAPGASRELHFNLSHSAGQALIALSYRGEVGVDLETLDRPWPDPLVRKLLTQPQLARLAALPPTRRRVVLCDLWVRKEAYVKALGNGIGLGFELEAGSAGDWTILPIDVGPDRRAAICARRPARAWIRRRRLEFGL